MTNYDVIRYVDAANTLVTELVADIKAGVQVSQETVLALNKFVIAAKAIEQLRDAIDNEKKRMN